MNTREESDRKEWEKMRRLIGKKFQLPNRCIICFIGENKESGDFFWISSDGEAKLLLYFDIIRQGKKKSVNILKFMLVDEGLVMNHTQWLDKHKNYKFDGRFYEKK